MLHYFALFLLWICVCLGNPSNEQFQLASVINALYGLIQFYEKDYSQLNVDGLFGLRLLEGQLKVLASEFDGGKHSQVSKDMQEKISFIAIEAGKLANKAVPHTYEKEPAYFNQFKYWVNVPYTITFDKPSTVDPKLWWSSKDQCEDMDNFNERTSDLCIAEILTAAERRAKNEVEIPGMRPSVTLLSKNDSAAVLVWGDCKLSKSCLQKFLGVKGCKEYVLTHQILYTSIAEQLDCLPLLDIYVSSLGYSDKMIGWRNEFCSNLYLEINRLLVESGGSIHVLDIPHHRDLIMEIVFTCGQFGFFQFATLEYLEAIMSWQNYDGCFKLKTQPSPIGRRLLFESRVSDGCLAHMSAVAAGALVTILRFILEPLPKEWAHMHINVQRHTHSFTKLDAIYGKFVNFTDPKLNVKPPLEEKDIPDFDKVDVEELTWINCLIFFWPGVPLSYIIIYTCIAGFLYWLGKKRRTLRYFTQKLVLMHVIAGVFVLYLTLDPLNLVLKCSLAPAYVTSPSS